MSALSESLLQNTCLEQVDLQQNRIFKVRDMKATKGFDMAGTVQQIRSCFKYLKQIRRIESLLINDWLYDDHEYPDAVADNIKEARALIPEKASFSTISSAKKGGV